MNRQVIIHDSKDALIEALAERFISTSSRLLGEKPFISVVLTGGSVGIGVLAGINASPRRDLVDWSRVHLWWGDERWVPRAHADRNELQAREALLNHVGLPAENIHGFPASDEGLGLDAAAEAYAAELRGAAPEGANTPYFDITFLGLGPDGHIASLFPSRDEINVVDATVVAVRDSPKPPPERLSLTLPVINASERVWLALAGTDKASPLGLALAGANRNLVPAAGVRGRRRTVFFVDQDASAEVPHELITSEY